MGKYKELRKEIINDYNKAKEQNGGQSTVMSIEEQLENKIRLNAAKLSDVEEKLEKLETKPNSSAINNFRINYNKKLHDRILKTITFQEETLDMYRNFFNSKNKKPAQSISSTKPSKNTGSVNVSIGTREYESENKKDYVTISSYNKRLKEEQPHIETYNDFIGDDFYM